MARVVRPARFNAAPCGAVRVGLLATAVVLAALAVLSRVGAPRVPVVAGRTALAAPLPPTPATKIVAGARAQIGIGYDPAYVSIAYPDGDVPKDRGVCTDVVVRGLRRAGYDLQRLIHEDMRRHFRAYPRNWGLRKPDPNIDHRRVPNQIRFLERHGLSLPRGASTPAARASWKPGDIVYWKLDGGGLDHCGIVSDRRGASGLPLVIHNLGGCVEEDCLTRWKITGHFRYPKG